MLLLYNPAHQKVDSYVQVKVNEQSYKVEDSQGNAVQSDVVCASHYDETNCDLYFLAELDHLSYK